MKSRSRLAGFLLWALSILICLPCLAQDPSPGLEGDPTPSEPGEADKAFTISDDHWYDLDAPTSIDYELDEIYAPHTPMFKTPLDPALNSLLDAQRQLY